MKRLTNFLMVGSFLFVASISFGQKLKSGDLTILKGQKTLNIQYDYSQMKVGKKTAEEYVTDGIADRNKKKPGSGDEWAVKWKLDRTERFQPTFETNFNGKVADAGLVANPGDTEAKYTLIVRILFFEPGFQTGIGPSKPASVNMMLDVVETASPDKILASVEYNKIPSKNMMGFDFDAGARMQSCFDRAGDNYGSFFYKNGLK